MSKTRIPSSDAGNTRVSSGFATRRDNQRIGEKPSAFPTHPTVLQGPHSPAVASQNPTSLCAPGSTGGRGRARGYLMGGVADDGSQIRPTNFRPLTATRGGAI